MNRVDTALVLKRAGSGFLLFRVLKVGSDARFDTIRAHFFKFLGTSCGQKKNNTIILTLHVRDRFLD